MLIGEYLLKEGLASEKDICNALDLQKKVGGRVGEILYATNALKTLDFYKALASFFGLEFLHLTERQKEIVLPSENARSKYVSELTLPLWYESGTIVVATADPSEKRFATIKKSFGTNVKIVATTKSDILFTLENLFSKTYSKEMTAELFEKDPLKSAMNTFTHRQILAAIVILTAFTLIMVLSFPLGIALLNAGLTISVTFILVYKLGLATVGLLISANKKRHYAEIDERSLPIYSILVPMFKEKKVTIDHLVYNLQQLDYPHHKLDIKLVLEEDDYDTFEIVSDLKLPPFYDIVLVPAGGPRTKPKACNYALKFARGEFITIYDAEDRPEPDQLKAAILAFREGDAQLACVQCSLNYYNSRENWLTKMFTMEYTFWFDLILPALSRFNLPVPLGGTSNHFKTDFLKDMVAWDPFNVTEDADLGIRMSRLKYRCRVINSTTYEEANCRAINWLKQRTRWMKGYMQTYLVHMRKPIRLYKELGAKGFITFHLFVGGTIICNLANIILLVISFLTLFIGSEGMREIFVSPTSDLALFNLIIGNVLLILLNLAAVLKRGMFDLAIYVITAPVYWFLQGIASYRALYQIFLMPSYWEKTDHGISKVFCQENIRGTTTDFYLPPVGEAEGKVIFEDELSPNVRCP
jgi:glycosyltransferase XagB